MPDLFPLLTYTPENKLVIQTDVDLMPSNPDLDWAHKAAIDTITWAEGAADIAVAREGDVIETAVDVVPFLGLDEGDDAHIERRSKKLIGVISNLVVLQGMLTDPRDRVAEFTATYPTVNVHHHMQRWLNARGLTEDVAKRCLEAMTLGAYLGNDSPEVNVAIHQSDNSIVAETGLFGSRLACRPERFRAIRINREGDEPTSEAATFDWMSLDLHTLGDCACLGASDTDRRRIVIDETSTKLYRMTDHNVVNPTQSVSLILGVGSLVHEAVQYTGTEDVFAGIEWRNPRQA